MVTGRTGRRNVDAPADVGVVRPLRQRRGTRADPARGHPGLNWVSGGLDRIGGGVVARRQRQLRARHLRSQVYALGTEGAVDHRSRNRGLIRAVLVVAPLLRVRRRGPRSLAGAETDRAAGRLGQAQSVRIARGHGRHQLDGQVVAIGEDLLREGRIRCAARLHQHQVPLDGTAEPASMQSGVLLALAGEIGMRPPITFVVRNGYVLVRVRPLVEPLTAGGTVPVELSWA